MRSSCRRIQDGQCENTKIFNKKKQQLFKVNPTLYLKNLLFLPQVRLLKGGCAGGVNHQQARVQTLVIHF